MALLHCRQNEQQVPAPGLIFAVMMQVRRDLRRFKRLRASGWGACHLPKICVDLAFICGEKPLRLLLLRTESRELLQQVPRPGLIFASNDAGQARSAAPQTPASKWVGGKA